MKQEAGAGGNCMHIRISVSLVHFFHKVYWKIEIKLEINPKDFFLIICGLIYLVQ